MLRLRNAEAAIEGGVDLSGLSVTESLSSSLSGQNGNPKFDDKGAILAAACRPVPRKGGCTAIDW